MPLIHIHNPCWVALCQRHGFLIIMEGDVVVGWGGGHLFFSKTNRGWATYIVPPFLRMEYK